MNNLFRLLLAQFLTISFFTLSFGQFTINGTISPPGGGAINSARITLFNVDTTYFAEERSDASGNYSFSNIPAGSFTIGASGFDLEYKTNSLTVSGNMGNVDFTLDADTGKGQWDLNLTAPEALGGTDFGILMADGKLFYCHDTEHPFYFDPAINDTSGVVGDDSVQGCVGPVLLPDGRVIFIGGALVPVYGPGSKKVKIFDPVGETWQTTGSMMDFRWYPSVAQLPNGRILIAGGGDENNPNRTRTSEIYDPITGTSRWVDSLAIGNEVSPICLLYNGKVLMTHRPPQLFDIFTEQWDLAADFVQGNRTPNGDHADHELTLLEDGRVVAMGFKSFYTGNPGHLVEIYDPVQNSWSLGANFAPVRSRCSSVYLPNKKILVLGGEKEEPSDPTPTNQWNYMSLADLYDPGSDSWRRLAHMNIAREYHANAVVVPDGRVVVVAGEGAPGNEPDSSIIEAYTPSYLNKGIRPEIHNLNNTVFERGDQITFEIQNTDAPTSVILMSNPSVTHNMNCGNNRYLELSFSQNGQSIVANIPLDSLQVPIGYYQLIVMVDDIPSLAKIINIGEATPTGMNNLVLDNRFQEIKVIPNPATHSPIIEFISEKNGPVIFDLFDHEGNKLQNLYQEQNLPSGTHQFSMEVKGLQSGVYIIRAEISGGLQSKRLIWLK